MPDTLPEIMLAIIVLPLGIAFGVWALANMGHRGYRGPRRRKRPRR